MVAVDALDPTPANRFTFGLWTVGSLGRGRILGVHLDGFADRRPHADAHRPNPRRAVVGGEGPHPASRAQPPLQSERDRDPRAVEREAIGAPEGRSPMMVPALKLPGFTFTSVSDAI
jgi:hypothetical protein